VQVIRSLWKRSIVAAALMAAVCLGQGPAPQIDKEAPPRKVVEVQVIRLRRSDIGFVAQEVEKRLEASGNRAPAAGPIKVQVDKRTNCLIVLGSPQMQERVKAIVLMLDGEAKVIRSAKGEKLTVGLAGKGKAIEVTATTRPSAGDAAPGSVYQRDLAAFFAVVEESYPFFDLKGIRLDWVVTKQRLAEKVEACTSGTEFLGIVVEAAQCLRDGHLQILETKADLPARPPQYYPGISFMPATRERVVVMYPPKGHEAELKIGTVVTEIDGTDARTVLEQRAKEAWAQGGSFSSPQRARLFAYRIALTGNKGQRHTITYLDGDRRRQVVLTAETTPQGWPHTYCLPRSLTRVGRSFWYTKLPSAVGYMYLRRVDDSVGPGIREALKKHPRATGWIADLRGNGGGGYDVGLINAIKAMPRPVAVLIDAGCISAGETLARDFRRYSGARLFGTKSAGSSSSKRQWKFPSGIAVVSFSQRSRWRSDRKAIEFNGIDPDVIVEPVPEELAAGVNSAIRRAEEYLKKQHPPAATRPTTVPAGT